MVAVGIAKDSGIEGLGEHKHCDTGQHKEHCQGHELEIREEYV
jgi:hypothetical protein